MTPCSFTEIEHTADWAIHVEADHFAQLLECAAWGMYELLHLEADRQTGEKRRVQLEAPDREGLLVAWLEELLFYLETEGRMVHEASVQTVGDKELVADLALVATHTPTKQIKAVTFHNLRIVDRDSGLETTIIFDV
jgi:SHS2 domain-containing protein